MKLFDYDERLPMGLSEFNDWADEIIELSELPNNDSMKFTLATMILHADPDKAYLKKEYFVNRLIKAAANQVAAQVMQDLKEKQQKAAAEAAAAAAAAAQPEATTPSEASSSEQPAAGQETPSTQR